MIIVSMCMFIITIFIVSYFMGLSAANLYSFALSYSHSYARRVSNGKALWVFYDLVVFAKIFVRFVWSYLTMCSYFCLDEI